jgi:hypothetical protein
VRTHLSLRSCAAEMIALVRLHVYFGYAPTIGHDLNQSRVGGTGSSFGQDEDARLTDAIDSFKPAI